MNFVYFGGGTPSYLSTRQLESLVSRLSAVSPWQDAEEITFECEPGTLSETKLSAIREMGVTRLSLGVENFDDRILEVNGRAHRSPEIFRAYEVARSLNFPQINIDLIAGMMGETDENWHAVVEATLKLSPDSVTIYQMELPFNTAISGDVESTHRFNETLPDWSTKRRWVKEAFEALERAGYHVGSAYTASKDPSRTKFLSRQAMAGRGHGWTGSGFVWSYQRCPHSKLRHVGNLQRCRPRAEIPLSRALPAKQRERMIREFVLQLKLGSIRPAYFLSKYRVNVLERFRAQFDSLKSAGYLAAATEEIVALTRDGLLRVDVLLRSFFLPQHTESDTAEAILWDFLGA